MFLFTKIRNSLSSRKLNSEIQQEMETSIDSLAALWTSGAVGLSVDPESPAGV